MQVSNHILWLPFICSLTRLQALVESCGGILLQSNANAGKGGNYYYYIVPGCKPIHYEASKGPRVFDQGCD